MPSTRRQPVPFLTLLIFSWLPSGLQAQDHTVADPVVLSIATEGLEHSQLEPLAQLLLDSIGPRLTGTPEYDAAADWLFATYESWGIPVRREPVGTWRGWRQGTTHVDLVSPRVRTLAAIPMAYSPGTGGALEGRVVAIPQDLTEATVDGWLDSVDGAFVMAMPPEPMCRARQELEANARPESVARIDSLRESVRSEWGDALEALGSRNPWRALSRLPEHGAAGLIMGWWSEGWGANKVFEALTREIPSFSLSCEDYGLLHRLATKGQSPIIRANLTAELTGEVPHDNIIAEIRVLRV